MAVNLCKNDPFGDIEEQIGYDLTCVYEMNEEREESNSKCGLAGDNDRD